MRVGFATTNLITVDDHFGYAKTVAVYEVNENGYEFIELRNFTEIPNDEYEKINNKIEALKDCSIIYVVAIGGTAAAKVVKAKIHPVKVKENTAIKNILDEMVEKLKTNPPPWLKKALIQEKQI
ncbi:MAG: nitrogen fixation protein NifX [Hydrogenothermaceae bacterium]|nr:nitrogen fixation protein NifX [Hydrogenothermaceae bacterium]